MKYFAAIMAIILGVALVWAVFFSGLILNKKTQVTDITNNSQKSNSTPTNEGSTSAPDTPEGVVKDGGAEAGGFVSMIMETNYGTIRLVLNETVAPKTTANFVKLASEGFYNNLTFHRIIPGFVIQGGDPKGDGTGGPGYTVPGEIGLKHKRGALATARTGDQINPLRASSGSQFYISLKDLPELDGQYTVFGQVVEGMDVVDKIAAVKTDVNDRPLQPVIIKKVSKE